jgi:FAD binding domain
MSTAGITEIVGFQGELLRPQDAGYGEARRLWNGAIDKRPAVIARCIGAADVMVGISYARSSGLPLAVRGGGHNVAGTASCDGGIVLDLSPMKELRIDPTTRTAWAQPGLLWGELDQATQALGLATTGGIVTHTGVAGLTLGGDIGWLMRKHGLTCDNLLEPLRRLAAPLLDLVTVKPYSAHQETFDPTVPHGLHYYWKSHYLDELGDEAIDTLVDHAWRHRSPRSYTIVFQLGGAVRRVPDEATAWPSRSAAGVVRGLRGPIGLPPAAPMAWLGLGDPIARSAGDQSSGGQASSCPSIMGSRSTRRRIDGNAGQRPARDLPTQVCREPLTCDGVASHPSTTGTPSRAGTTK